MKVYKKPTTRTIVLCEEYALMSGSDQPTTSTVDPELGHGANGEDALTRRGQSIWDDWSD